jgi:catechol 2,3-dioxygenase-like lactoylglutathione lyase family enzyme
MRSLHTNLVARGLALLLLLAIVGGMGNNTVAQENDSTEIFSSPVLDLGIVVKDLEKSVFFYKDVIGCKEVNGFTAPSPFATSIGLVDNMEVVARVFVLGAGEKQSRLKMMSFPKAKVGKSDQTFIHSTLGFSYLTLHVTDLSATIERLKKAKVAFLGDTPVPLGGKNALLVFRDPDGNFIELIGPMQD